MQNKFNHRGRRVRPKSYVSKSQNLEIKKKLLVCHFKVTKNLDLSDFVKVQDPSANCFHNQMTGATVI